MKQGIPTIQRQAEPVTGRYEYFIVNHTVSVISVNGEPFNDYPLVIGPLPEFSIIEVHDRVLFWWRSRDGLVRGNVRKRKRGGPGNKGDEDGGDSDHSSDDSNNGRPKPKKRKTLSVKELAHRKEAWQTISQALEDMARRKAAETLANDTEPSEQANKSSADEAVPEHDINLHSMLTRSKDSGHPPTGSSNSKSTQKKPTGKSVPKTKGGKKGAASRSEAATSKEASKVGKGRRKKHTGKGKKRQPKKKPEDRHSAQPPSEEAPDSSNSQTNAQPEKEVPGAEQPTTGDPNTGSTQDPSLAEETHANLLHGEEAPQEKPTQQGEKNHGSSPSKTQNEKPSSREERMATWKSPYDAALKGCLSKKPRHLSRLPEPKPLSLSLDATLTDEQVTVAIGSIWAAVLEKGRIFSFSDVAGFKDRLNHLFDEISRCAAPSNVFIIPLHLPPTSRGSESGDHHVLAVAHWYPNRQSNVQVEIYDSGSGKNYKRPSMESLRDVLQSSGWLGDVLVRLNQDHIVSRSVARSATFPAADGIHTVLNAWAVMLGLSLEQNNVTIDTDRQVYMEALNLIGLATSGSIDFLTVEAFLYRHGFTQVPDYEDWVISDASKQQDTVSFRRTQAYSMDKASLANFVNRSLAEQHEQPIARRDPYQDNMSKSQTASHLPHSKENTEKWYAEYQAGIERVENRSPDHTNDGPAHHIEKLHWLEDLDSTLAIASIWCPIVLHGKDSYTYSTPGAFSNLCYNFTKPETLDIWQAEANIFLIPLTYDQNPARDVSKMPHLCGHTVLVVAEKRNERLNIKYYDSLKRNNSIVMRRYAHAFLQNTGWLGEYTLHDAYEESMDVCPQSEATCGVHTILNAWAHMLGIEVAPVTSASGVPRAAYNEALRVINLALQGKADYRLIMAFMQYRRFAIPRDWQAWNDEIEWQTDPNRRVLDDLRSEFMTYEIIMAADEHIRELSFIAS